MVLILIICVTSKKVTNKYYGSLIANPMMEMTANYSGDIFTHIKKAATTLGRPIKNERVYASFVALYSRTCLLHTI